MTRIVTVILLICCLLTLTASAENETIWFYEPSDEVLVNPLVGNAVWADSAIEHSQPFSLVYANFTWAELEPAKGQYAFEALEEKYHFHQWKELGKHLILRFVMDIPGDTTHFDLPSWLVDTIHGNTYSTLYGKGWSPDYEDPVLLSAHQQVIRALGSRYDKDPFVAFVEIGSLGHWGEWHIHEKAGSMPCEEIRNQYVLDYLDAFSETHLMMRRPFRIAAETGMGLFNDAVGDLDATLIWLDWIKNGGYYDGDDSGILPMAEVWKTSPIGGELTTNRETENVLSDFSLISLLRLSHTSWIGPHSFSEIANKMLQHNLDQLLNSIGYRLRITWCSICENTLSFEMTNDGIAPFYYPWSVQIRLANQDEELILSTDLDLREILPRNSVVTSIHIPDIYKWENVSIGVLNPVTGIPSVSFAMKVPVISGWSLLASLKSPPRS